MLFDSKKLLCDALRVKLMADRCSCKYAFHLSHGTVRVASAVDYHLARLAGMKDFWKHVPPCRERIDAFLPRRDKTNARDGEWGFALVRDGDGETYAPACVIIVRKGDLCVWLSPDQFRDKVCHAQPKAEGGDEKRDQVGNGDLGSDFHAGSIPQPTPEGK